MRLSPGVKLGPYEILSPLGAGGMGEVYKARDTRLDRLVAVKVLPEHIAKRADLRARFEREARAVASLNHPNICVLHDIGNQDGSDYMVMELLEGETLAARIAKGALPLDQALTSAAQIADALDRAHRAGVTHRDIKPANVMITRDGVKVMDFGLAKSAPPKIGPTSETLTAALTIEGTVLGTPQYMAPEQFEGKEADARSDIWAFGATLYEMLTGQRAFQGKSYSSLVGAILSADPPPMAVQPFTPAWLERLVRRCLAKDPEDRRQSMRDIVLEIRTPPADAPAAAPVRSRLPWAIAAAAVLSAVALAGMMLSKRVPVTEAGPMQFEIKVPNLSRLVTVSPNGRFIAWRDEISSRLHIRAIDSLNVRNVESRFPTSFSWSPDSRYLTFVSRGELQKIEVPTSISQVIWSNPGTTIPGTAWTPDGNILMGSTRGPLLKVRATGGTPPSPLWELDAKAGEFAQSNPIVVRGTHVLYNSLRSDPAIGGLYLASLDGRGEKKRIRGPDRHGFIAPDTLLVNENGWLLAIPLDPGSGAASEPVVIVDGGVRSFAASEDGKVIAFSSGVNSSGEELVLYDRSGRKLETIAEAEPSINSHLELSPDGKRLLLERQTADNNDLWTVELGRNVVSRLTFGQGNEGPGVWSADGQKIYLRSNRIDMGESILEIGANGSGSEKLVHKTATHHMHASPDGKHLIFERTIGSAGLQTLDLSSGKVSVYLTSNASSPQFSPDSKFVAYESNETGRYEVYVQTFPAGGGKWQISTGGGIEPRWRADGREIFFDRGDGTVMVAAVELRGGSVAVTSAKELFKFTRGRASGTSLAVTPDGKTFAIKESKRATESSIIVKLNWKLPGR